MKFFQYWYTKWTCYIAGLTFVYFFMPWFCNQLKPITELEKQEIRVITTLLFAIMYIPFILEGKFLKSNGKEVTLCFETKKTLFLFGLGLFIGGLLAWRNTGVFNPYICLTVLPMLVILVRTK